MVQHFAQYVRVGRWQVVLSLVLLLAIVFLRAPWRVIPDALFVSDGFGYYVYLPSLLLDGDLDLDNQLRRVPYESRKSYFDRIPLSGLRANPFPVGSAVLWFPFFAVAAALAPIAAMAGAETGLAGFGFAYELPTYVGAFFYGVAGFWLLERLLAQMFTRSVVAQSLLAALVCSPYAYYLLIEPDMSHLNAAFALALFLCLLCRVMSCLDSRYHPWIFVGLSLGLIALVRPYNGLVAIAVLPAAWFVCRRHSRPLVASILRVGVCAAAALVAFLPQVVIATILYGKVTFLPPGTGYDEMRWTTPNFAALAVSIFSFFPVLMVGFVGLVWGTQHAAASGDRTTTHGSDVVQRAFLNLIAPCLFIALLTVMYITASYPRGSTFGDSFGQRRIVDWVPVLAVGLASVFARVPERWRRLFTIGLTVLSLAEIVLAGLYVAKLVPHWGGTAQLGLDW